MQYLELKTKDFSDCYLKFCGIVKLMSFMYVCKICLEMTALFIEYSGMLKRKKSEKGGNEDKYSLLKLFE